MTTSFVVALTGGSFPKYAVAAKVDVAIVIDALKQLDLLPNHKEIYKIPLGKPNDTALSILERVTNQYNDPDAAQLLQEYNTRPNINISDGMAADPRLSKIALKDLAYNGTLEEHFNQIYTRIQVARNGQLLLLYLMEAFSKGGGTGSGAGSLFGDYFIEHIKSKSCANIHRCCFWMGALSHSVVANKALSNTSKTIVDDVSALVSQSDPRVTRLVQCLELPLRDNFNNAIGDNRDIRNFLAATLLQARLSPDVMHLIDSTEINNKTGKFSEFLSMSTQWSASIDKSSLLRAASVALSNILNPITPSS